MPETPNLSRRLSSQDAGFLYAESASAPMHIGSVGFFEGTIDLGKLTRSVEERLHFVPRYRQRIADVPLNLAHPTWEDDTEFRIEDHLVEHRLAGNTSDAEAMAAMMKAYEPLMERSRPLWDIHVFTNLAGNRSAVLSRVHHCLVDGVSGMELVKILMDFAPEAPQIPQPEKVWEPRAMPNAFERLAAGFRDLARGQLDALSEAAIELMRDPSAVSAQFNAVGGGAAQLVQALARPIVAAPWNSAPVTSARALAWSCASFADYRAIRSRFGGTINDVVLTVLSEGAARYLKHHDVALESGARMRIGCPVNVRRSAEQTALGNRVSMMFPEVPAEPMDVAERLRVIREETERIKVAQTPQVLERVLSLGDVVPPSLMALGAQVLGLGIQAIGGQGAIRLPITMRSMGINFIATNVPGIQVPLYMAGQRCIDSIGLLFLTANLGYGVAIQSYNQNLYFGMIADPNLLPDLDLMKACVEEALDELRGRVTIQRAAA